ncbi:MAG: winged helix-turn-helix domain-containing protein [Zestosphaera sp.]
MSRKRSKLEVVFDVLDALSKEAVNPTRLATLANMPYDRLRKLLNELIERGLVMLEDHGRSQTVVLTLQGYQLHEELKRIKKILEDYGMLD